MFTKNSEVKISHVKVFRAKNSLGREFSKKENLGPKFTRKNFRPKIFRSSSAALQFFSTKFLEKESKIISEEYLKQKIHPKKIETLG